MTLEEALSEVDRSALFNGAAVTSVHTERFGGETALHIWAKWGGAEAIRVLVANGADINKPGEDDNTPLHYAAMFGKLSAIEALVSLGAANPRDRYGNYAIDLCQDHEDVRAFLGASGYDA